MKLLTPKLLIILLGLVIPMFTLASDFKGGKNITIDQPVEHNLYIAGAEIRIEAPLSKDLIAAGGNIVLSDIIGEDAVLAGGEVIVEAVVQGDCRVASGKVWITEDIMGDLMIAGGEVRVGKEVTVFGDLGLVAGKLVFEGQVEGNMNLMGGDIDFQGIAKKEASIKGAKLNIAGEIHGSSKLVAQELQFGSKAFFKDQVSYFNEKGELDFGPYLAPGVKAVYQPDLKPDFGEFQWQRVKRGFFLLFLYRILAAFVLIAVGVMILDRFFSNADINLKAGALNYLALGLLYFLLVPAFSFVAMLSIIGIPLGLIAAVLFAITVAVGHIITSIVAAYELEKFFEANWSRGRIILVSFGVFALLKLLSFLPVLGMLINVLVVMLAYGAIIQQLRKSRGKNAELSDMEGNAVV